MVGAISISALSAGCFNAQQWASAQRQPSVTAVQARGIERARVCKDPARERELIQDIEKHARQLAELDESQRVSLALDCSDRVAEALFRTGASPVAVAHDQSWEIAGRATLIARREQGAQKPVSDALLAAARVGTNLTLENLLVLLTGGVRNANRDFAYKTPSLGSEPNDRYLVDGAVAAAASRGRPRDPFEVAIRRARERESRRYEVDVASVATLLAWGLPSDRVWELADCAVFKSPTGNQATWSEICRGPYGSQHSGYVDRGLFANRVALVKLLVDKGPAPPSSLCLSEPAFLQFAPELLMAGVSPHSTPACTARYGSPLHEAIETWEPRDVRFEKDGRALAFDRAAMVRWLVSKGLPPYRGVLGDILAMTDASRWSLAEDVMRHGASSDDASLEIALMQRDVRSHVPTVRAMLARGGNPNYCPKQSAGQYVGALCIESLTDRAGASGDRALLEAFELSGGMTTDPAVLAGRRATFARSKQQHSATSARIDREREARERVERVERDKDNAALKYCWDHYAIASTNCAEQDRESGARARDEAQAREARERDEANASRTTSTPFWKSPLPGERPPPARGFTTPPPSRPSRPSRPSSGGGGPSLDGSSRATDARNRQERDARAQRERDERAATASAAAREKQARDDRARGERDDRERQQRRGADARRKVACDAWGRDKSAAARAHTECQNTCQRNFDRDRNTCLRAPKCDADAVQATRRACVATCDRQHKSPQMPSECGSHGAAN